MFACCVFCVVFCVCALTLPVLCEPICLLRLPARGEGVWSWRWRTCAGSFCMKSKASSPLHVYSFSLSHRNCDPCSFSFIACCMALRPESFCFLAGGACLGCCVFFRPCLLDCCCCCADFSARASAPSPCPLGFRFLFLFFLASAGVAGAGAGGGAGVFFCFASALLFCESSPPLAAPPCWALRAARRFRRADFFWWASAEKYGRLRHA